MNVIARTLLWTITTLIVLVAGFILGNRYPIDYINSEVSPNSKMQSLISYISNAYVDSISTEELVEKAIPTIVQQLDPHSSYIPSSEMELIGRDLEGHFSGIGVQFSILRDTVIVISVITGGPSEAAGIMAGDKIVKVNDSLFVGEKVTNESVFKQLRGAKDSKIKLSIKRHQQPELIDFTITRGDVPIKTVDAFFTLADSIGYIKIDRFGSTTYREFVTALSSLNSQEVSSLIVDLRQNSGGYLYIAQQIVNEFLPKDQLIVYTEGRHFPKDAFFANGQGVFQNQQLVLLIDEGSASASEIFAGAMQDTDRGLIVGRRSFGKGLVQQQFDFRDGSAIRLTTARYYTPLGRCIQKNYNLGEQEEYAMDLINRWKNGEMENMIEGHNTDSLPKFYTPAGRLVYGNDGIMPDVFVPQNLKGINSYFSQIVSEGYLYEFTIMYADMHRDKLREISSNPTELIAFLEQQPLVENLADYALQKGVRKRPHFIYQSQQRLKKQIIYNILQQFVSANHYQKYWMQQDEVVSKATELIGKQKATPLSIQKEEYK